MYLKKAISYPTKYMGLANNVTEMCANDLYSVRGKEISSSKMNQSSHNSGRDVSNIILRSMCLLKLK